MHSKCSPLIISAALAVSGIVVPAAAQASAGTGSVPDTSVSSTMGLSAAAQSRTALGKTLGEPITMLALVNPVATHDHDNDFFFNHNHDHVAGATRGGEVHVHTSEGQFSA